MAKTHYSEFNSFLIALQNRGESLRIVDELFEIIHLDGLNSTDASLDRIGCNIGLRAALSMNLENKAEEILSFMEKNEIEIAADTIHIMLSHYFLQRNYSYAEQLFKYYFCSHKIPANSRTLNIMMEGYRNLGNRNRVLYYFSLFQNFSLSPDKYTYSSLIRVFGDEEGILKVMGHVNETKILSLPLLRIATESLGKLGSIAPAVQLQRMRRFLTKSDVKKVPALTVGDLHFTKADVDSLIASLLSDAAVNRKVSILDPIGEFETCLNGLTGAQAAWTLVFSPFIESDNKSIEITSHSERHAPSSTTSGNKNQNGNDFLSRLGGKGLCILLTYLHRTLRAQRAPPSQSFMLVPGLKNLSYSEIRDLLWLSFLQHVESGIAEGKESAVEYCNGRMCDAFMRCFSDDVEAVQSMWKRDFLPMAIKLEKLSPGSFDEISSKAMESLMFISGCKRRADVGLQVAITARKRAWNSVLRKKLARSYSSGYRYYLDNKLSGGEQLFPDILVNGLERSMEAELGTLLEPLNLEAASRFTFWSALPSRIRLQFNNSRIIYFYSVKTAYHISQPTLIADSES